MMRAGLLVTALALVGWVRLLPWSLDVPELRYRGADGRAYVYLGDYDSYTWLRSARNYLTTGTTCDAIADGECRDTHANAPVGRRDPYHRSLHIAAIVAIHRLITLFDPQFPLPASSFFVPVIVGLLGLFPAFSLARRLGGDLAGLGAALLVGVNPIFLERSMGSDNDVWNVVLPLFLMWSGAAAMAAGGWRRGLSYTGLAAVFAALHAVTWRGWGLTYGVLMVALLGRACVLALRYLRRTRTARVWRDPEVRRAVSMLAMFLCASEFLTALAGGEASPLRVAAEILIGAWRGAGPSSASPAAAPWPDVLQTVGELRQPNLAGIADAMGGTLYFFVGWLGLLILVLPRRGWQWWHFAVLIGGNYLYRYLLTAPEVGRSGLIILLSLPLAVAVAASGVAADGADDPDEGEALAVVLWFLAALYLSFGGLRFVMLLVPPFAIACAVALGRLHGWLTVRVAAVDQRAARFASPVLFLLVAALLLAPLRDGYAAARAYAPRMNDAWWSTLETIRDETPPDAIVTTWWDYGYWVKYVADRRVNADGGSLRTHIPHWVGRALLAPDDEESVGLLRMLDCGSDATPEPEGRRGAFGALLAGGSDQAAAHAMVVQLAERDREAARALLTASGQPAPAAAEVLAASHCSPPPGYLVLSSAMIAQEAWRDLGGWDPAPAGAHLRGTRYVTPQWRRCRVSDPGREMRCPIGAVIDPTGTRLDEFVVVLGRPETGRLRARGNAMSDPFDGTPGLLLLAGEGGLESHRPASPTFPDLGVLVDVAGERVLVGSPDLLRSTFTQLMYLDGRYVRGFEKFADHTGFGGERVVTWRINWDAAQSRRPAPASPAPIAPRPHDED